MLFVVSQLLLVLCREGKSEAGEGMRVAVGDKRK